MATIPQSNKIDNTGSMDTTSAPNCREAEDPKHVIIKSDPIIDPFYVQKIPSWKRTMDIVGSIWGLVLFLPVMGVIALIIKIVSKGPILFKQLRIGFGGKPFQFIKFRTMKHNIDVKAHREYLSTLIKNELKSDQLSMPMLKIDSESQIIPFGNILRKSCLDELPQLINVLKGEMSLVGPRPPIPYEVNEYLQWHNSRFDCMPGMTGLWQVSGKNNLSFREMIQLDIRYIKNITFWRDIKILLETPLAIILNAKNGYKKNVLKGGK